MAHKRLATGPWLVLGISAFLLLTLPARAAKIQVHLRLNPQVYRSTSYSEPPQIAVWIESCEGNRQETLWITRRMAENRWEGKLFCPNALPIWEARFKSRWPIIRGRRSLPDAITGATPKDRLDFEAVLPHEGEWILRIEVNLSGDYNRAFSYRSVEGAPDMEGNGQPSLLYEGKLSGRAGRVVVKPKGRSRPWIASGEIVTDMSGLDTALNIFEELKVAVR